MSTSAGAATGSSTASASPYLSWGVMAGLATVGVLGVGVYVRSARTTQKALAAKRFDIDGKQAFSKNDFQKAIDLFSLAIDADPTVASYYARRASARLFMGDFDRAAQDASVAIGMASDVRSYYVRARAYFHHGQYSDAMADLDHVLKNSKSDLTSAARLLYQSCESHMQKQLAIRTKNERKQNNAQQVAAIPGNPAAQRQQIYETHSGNPFQPIYSQYEETVDSQGNRYDRRTMYVTAPAPPPAPGQAPAAVLYAQPPPQPPSNGPSGGFSWSNGARPSSSSSSSASSPPSRGPSSSSFASMPVTAPPRSMGLVIGAPPRAAPSVSPLGLGGLNGGSPASGCGASISSHDVSSPDRDYRPPENQNDHIASAFSLLAPPVHLPPVPPAAASVEAAPAANPVSNHNPFEMAWQRAGENVLQAVQFGAEPVAPAPPVAVDPMAPPEKPQQPDPSLPAPAAPAALPEPAPVAPAVHAVGGLAIDPKGVDGHLLDDDEPPVFDIPSPPAGADASS